MDPAYAAEYGALQERHWWWRARERLLLDRISRLRPPGGFGAILDVGCGGADWFGRLRAFGAPEGVEPDPGLAAAAARGGARVHAGAFDAGFHPGHRFGLVLMLDVLEHLDDDLGALRHARALLEPGGVLIATVPASAALWTGHDVLNAHRRRYTTAELARRAEDAALRVLEVRYLFHWLAAPKLLAAAAHRRFPRPPRPPRLLPRALDAALFRWCLLEQRTWGRLPLPFGSSALLVAAADPGP
jgi:SAM-dependent methyltransferase